MGTSFTPPQASPFTRAVVDSMRKLYPEALADKSYDNTGLLLEAPFDPRRRQKNSVLLTIDLTRAVADEAIEHHHSVVVAYHPIIFRGLKSLTLENSQQASLLRLAANSISVYCPHTAVDTVPGGMADWLCDVVTQSPDTSRSNLIPHTRSVIAPSPSSALSTANTNSSSQYTSSNTGAGRLLTYSHPQPLTSLLRNISQTLNLPRLSIAIPQTSLESISIRTVGICPGSGSSVLSACTPPPDLVFTGELSHHEALAVVERGGCVVTTFHSNSERGYLAAVMQKLLLRESTSRWEAMREEVKEEETEILDDDSVSVVVSERDRDPFAVVSLDELGHSSNLER